MSFLLDTNMISETRRRNPDTAVLAWLDPIDHKDLYISVLTLGELAIGIARLQRKDPSAAAALSHWLQGIEELFADRVIGIDATVAKAWGGLNADRPLPVIDSLLAATAKVHGFTLVTRKVKDVASTGVTVIDPWADPTAT